MALNPGQRIGPYEVIGSLGAGGMGEVYRARDTTLDRDVALKILPPALAGDPERLARFEREAKTLASLNHPHIAHVYGLTPLSVSDATARGLVMELVEGEDLSDRIARGAIPLDEALPMARQIAQALEAAHAAGVVHRDLKPANIKLGTDAEGMRVKVLDFGLAKAAAAARSGSSDGAVNSPTITTPAITAAGVVLGTAAYMSPEQAKGRAVDRRADVWAFGAVLYEMLAGTRAFAGDDVSETLAAILRDEPDWSRLPSTTPASILRLLRRSLTRDPHARIPDIAIARIEIDEALTAVTAPAAVRGASRSRRVALIATAAASSGLVVGALVTTVILRAPRGAGSAGRVVHLAIGALDAWPQLSRDGAALVMVRDRRLLVRELSDFGERTLEGTEGASSPFWSPDGASIGFFVAGTSGTEIRSIRAAGGATRTIAAAPPRVSDTQTPPFAPFGAAWCEQGVVFSRWAKGLWRAPLAGGEQQIAPLDAVAGDQNLGYPSCLDDGRLLAVRHYQGKNAIVVIDGARRTTLVEFSAGSDSSVRSPLMTRSNAVVFERQEETLGLWSLPVDMGVTRATGPPQLLLAGALEPSYAAGMLTALTGVQRTDRFLTWVDRTGKRLGVFGQPQEWFSAPSLASDGTRLIVLGRRDDPEELWLHEERGVQRWTFTDDNRARAGNVRSPAWSPTRNEIVYVDGGAIVLRNADGGELRRVAEAPNAIHTTWTPDGSAVLYQDQRVPTGSAPAEIWIVGVHPPFAARRLVSDGREPAVSPDGTLLAYMSQATGRREVYLTTFPAPSTIWPVSTDGGRHPRWARASELVYPCGPTVGADPNSHRYLCAARIESRRPLRVGASTILFEPLPLHLRATYRGGRAFDIAADGRILISTEGVEGAPFVSLIENLAAWTRRIK